MSQALEGQCVDKELNVTMVTTYVTKSYGIWLVHVCLLDVASDRYAFTSRLLGKLLTRGLAGSGLISRLFRSCHFRFTCKYSIQV